MTASFRIEPVSLAALDAQLWTLGPVRIVRSDELLFLECDDGTQTSHVIRAFARAGARVTGAAQPCRPPLGTIAALAPHLDRIAAGGILDVVSVRPLTAGEATARLVTRDLLGRRRRDADVIRNVLRDRERVFLWRRVVWADPRQLRSRRLGPLRPVVFDRAALHRPEDALAFVSRDALTRWAR